MDKCSTNNEHSQSVNKYSQSENTPKPQTHNCGGVVAQKDAVIKIYEEALKQIRGKGPLLSEEECIDDSEELIEMYIDAQDTAEKSLHSAKSLLGE